MTDVHAEDRALLRNLVKDESPAETVLGLALSVRPEFSLEVSGQRVDLLLSDTIASPSLGPLPQDGTILRILTIRKGPDLMISLLLAHPPKEARVVAEAGGTDLAVHVSWNAGTRKVRPAISSHLRGVQVINEKGTNARIAARSRYAPHWKIFYQEFQTAIEWQMPVRYTFPELPGPAPNQAVAGSPAAVLQEAWQHSRAGRWPEVLDRLCRLPGAEALPSGQPIYLLLYSAALVQEGDYDSARKLYQQFRTSYPASSHQDLFTVLLAWGRARAGNPYGAVIDIAGQLQPEKGQPGRDLAGLLQAEVQLAVGRPRKALERLEQIGDADGPRLSLVVLLRTADARAALGRYREALTAYRAWLTQGDVKDLDAYSLVHLATSLEQEKKFREAGKYYIRLADLIKEPAGRALALFAAARTVLQLGETDKAGFRFTTVRKDYPGTEGAFRAWLKELDLVMARGKKGQIMARSSEYAKIAATAPSRGLREESAFKYALTMVLYGEKKQGLESLQKFRRDFACGALRGEADFLTLEHLAPLVTGLLEKGKSLEALVLVQQNRDLLTNLALPPRFALAVAGMFRDLGLQDRAAHVYSYLLNDAEGTNAEEPLYLPLVEALAAARRHGEALTMARRYQERFPAGKSLVRLQLFQGRALLALGHLDEAAALLSGMNDPPPEVAALRNRLLLALAARDGAASDSLDGLLAATDSGERPETQMLRAERLLRKGQAGPALAIFQQLIATDSFTDLARYRSAQICLDRGERQRGVNFLQDLVDKGNDRHWQDLAREILPLAEGR